MYLFFSHIASRGVRHTAILCARTKRPSVPKLASNGSIPCSAQKRALAPDTVEPDDQPAPVALASFGAYACHSSNANRLETSVQMLHLQKVLDVATQELNVDPRKIGVRTVSQFFPQHHFNRLRTMLLRALGVRVAPKSCFAGPLKITGTGSIPDLLSIGPACYLTGPLHIDLMAPVRIGAHVYMGYEVMLVTADHDLGPSPQRCAAGVHGPIEIGDGAWIGSRALILPGIRIGSGAVVAAGAVVTKDVAPNTLVAGVPAKFVRNLEEEPPPPSDRRGRLTISDRPRHSVS
jgi:maltose O-acetyltransferase